MALVYTTDDDPVISLFLEAALSNAGHEVVSFDAGPDVVVAVRSRPPDLLMTDIQMVAMDGFEVMKACREHAPHLPVIMVTASSQLNDAIAALRSGATDYVTKPIDPDLLSEVVDRALRVGRLEAENRRFIRELSARDEALRKELALARTIQREMLPLSTPAVPGLEVGFRFVPAGDIGGDYFHFAPSEDGRRLGLILSDISGHGIPAALLFCLFKEVAEEHLHPDSPVTPGDAMAIVNRRIARSFPTGNFASTIYAIFEPESNLLRCVKGGQEPLLVIRNGEVVEQVATGGLLVGAFDPAVFGEEVYEEARIGIEPGDTVLLYTDGLIEALNSEGLQAGPGRLREWLRAAADLSPQALVDRLVMDSFVWSGRIDPEDDVTAIAVKWCQSA